MEVKNYKLTKRIKIKYKQKDAQLRKFLLLLISSRQVVITTIDNYLLI